MVYQEYAIAYLRGGTIQQRGLRQGLNRNMYLRVEVFNKKD